MLNTQFLIGIGTRVFGVGIDLIPTHWTLKCEPLPASGQTTGWKFLCFACTYANFGG